MKTSFLTKTTNTTKRGSLLLKRLKHFVLLLSALASFTLVRAQQPVELQLRDALKYALEANQNARKARLDVENSQYQIDEVRSRALPQVVGSGGITYNPILQQSALPGDFFGQPGKTVLVAFGQKWNANAGLSLSQTLFDQSVFTGLKAAKTTAEFYRLNSQLTWSNISTRFDVTFVYNATY